MFETFLLALAAIVFVPIILGFMIFLTRVTLVFIATIVLRLKCTK